MPEVSPAPVPPTPLPAAPGMEVEREIAAGESHAYRLSLAAGRYAEVTVEQRGIDLVIHLQGPDGRPERRVDSLYGPRGMEPVPWLGGPGGDFLLEVQAPAGAGAGSYLLRLDALRPPTAADRGRVAGEEAFAAGEALRRQGGEEPLQRAVERGLAALELFRAAGSTHREADVFLSLGSIHSELGQYSSARRAYGQALELFRATGRTHPLPPALLGLGRALRILGEPEEALVCYREALAWSRELGNRWNEVTALGNLGKIHASRGEADEALGFLEEAVAAWRELGVVREEALTLNDLGRLYLRLGESRQAIDRFEEAIGLLREADEAGPTGMILGSLGTAHGQMGEPKRGIAFLDRALEIHRRTGNRREAAVALHELGRLHREAGELEEARRAYLQALEIDRELGHRRDEATTLHSLAWLHHDLGEVEEAVALYREALGRFTAMSDRSWEAVSLLGLARARRQQGELAPAQADVEAALERIEELRAEPATPELRSSYFASKQQYYAFYVDLLMELHRREPAAGHDRRAFEASERARARTLLETLSEPGEGRRDGALGAEEATLARRLHQLELRRMELAAAGVDGEETGTVERELRRVLARHRRVRAALRGTDRSRSAPSRARPLSLEQIQHQVLDGESLLLEYFLGEERSFLWAVTPDRLESYELPGRAVIEAAARRALSLLPESHHRIARARTGIVLQEVARLVLTPVGHRLAGRRLLVAADGILHYLPFAALPNPTGSGAGAMGAEGAGTAPLIADHEVVTLPSASILPVLRRRSARRPPAPGTVAVLADPVFPPGDYPPLPFSRREAEAILALAPAAERLRLLGFDANRERALGPELSRYRMVHFATHGLLDASYPEMSGLVLSLVDRQGRPRNGFLRAHEITDLSLSAELVTLSACRTALGREVRGEGLVGLTRAFLDAGAERVLVSLWPVEDRATAELMSRLYQSMLEAGLPPAAALRQAQLSFLEEPDRRAPFFWAGFVLQGEWR